MRGSMEVEDVPNQVHYTLLTIVSFVVDPKVDRPNPCVDDPWTWFERLWGCLR